MTVCRKFSLVSLLVVAAVALAAAPLGAGTMLPPLDVSPTTVEPGGTVTVRNFEGGECVGGTVEGDVLPLPLSFWQETPNADGDWEFQFTVPESIASRPDGTPIPIEEQVDELEIHARCVIESSGMGVGASGADGGFEYESAIVTIAGASDPVDPPTTPTGPSTQPATAVTGTPRLTG